MSRFSRTTNVEVSTAFIGAILSFFFVGLILWATYGAFAPDSLPELSYFPAVGIVYLFKVACNWLGAGIRGDA